MRDRRRLVTMLIAALGVASASTASMMQGASPPEEPPVLRRATPDPERRVRLEAWRRSLERAQPALSATLRRLRRERRWWRGRQTVEGCRRARLSLMAVDRRALSRGAEHADAVAVDTVLDELARAVAACFERRYFELDYRLRVAESTLTRVRLRLRRRLATPPRR